MKPTSAIQKGKILENFVVEELRLKGFESQAHRNPGSGSGLRKGDIGNGLGICFECKNTAQPNLGVTLRQVNRESMGTQEPVVVWHMPNTPLADSKVIIDWHFFLDLLMARKNNASREDILDRYTIKNHLDKAIFHLKQVRRDV